MQLKCVLAAVGKCDKDAEFMLWGTAYCKEHAKEKIEQMEELIKKQMEEKVKKEES